MKILAVDCSAGPASAAIIEDGRLLASSYVNVKLTHSQTLLPMIKNILDASMCSLSDIGGFAISNGPGSFTGIRIGISAVKGMAAAKSIPCAGISTLRAAAENYIDTDCVVCAVMDARCNQVYNALFDIKDGKAVRLCEDRALMCTELCDDLKKRSKNFKNRVIIVGDGAEVFYPYVKAFENYSLADASRRFQNAVGVGFCAEAYFGTGNTVTPDKLLPFYLRLPQAERELKMKTKGAETNL